jgi:hypothetical protein
MSGFDSGSMQRICRGERRQAGVVDDVARHGVNSQATALAQVRQSACSWSDANKGLIFYALACSSSRRT